MKFSKKYLTFLIVLTLLFTMGAVFASDNGTDVISDVNSNSVDENLKIDEDSFNSYDNVLSDTDHNDSILKESNEVVAENWAKIQYYSSLNDDNYVIKLKENTNYYPSDPASSDNQIVFKNNVTIIGAPGAYIGDSSPNARNITYAAMFVPDNSGVGITLKGVTFKWISTRYQNDAVFCVMGGNSTNYIEDCSFSEISTTIGHSSILQIKSGDAILKNCSFINCTTDFGCLSVYNPDDDPTKICTRARMQVSDSYFESNYARTEPGCINNCGILLVRNSTFYKNSAFWWAGAIHTHGGGNTTIYDSNFTDNLAGWNGGALYTYSYLQIYNTIFAGNNCTTNNGGGAIGACKYLHAPYITIRDSLFEDNANNCWGLDELSTTGTGRGGAISLMDEGGLDVRNTTFIHNAASIGTAICAISSSYGSPDVVIVNNTFINHTRAGDVLVVRVSSDSTYEVHDNYYLNNSFEFVKLKLVADDKVGDTVVIHIDPELKNPNSFEKDILDTTPYDIFINGVYDRTVIGKTFSLKLQNGENCYVSAAPCISNSKTSDILVGVPKEYIYVSQKSGKDTNDGSTRSKPVATIAKAIELARGKGNIIIMDGTFKETNLTIDYNLTVIAEKNAVITFTGNGFVISDGDVKFENITFKNCKYGSSIKNRIISQTSTGYLTLEGCVFEGNEYKTHIEANKLEAENLVFNNNKDGSVIKADSLFIKSSIFTNNVATYTKSNGLIMYKSTNLTKFEAENLTFIGNTVNSGCILSQKIQAKITDCTFISNTGTNRGSAVGGSVVGTTSSGSTLIESCKFINNKDTGRYSSVVYLSTAVLIRDSIIINNTYENTNNWYLNGNDAQLKKLIANNNWWGNTPDNLSWPNLKEFAPSNKLPNGGYPAQYILVLNATAWDNEIELNKRIPVQFIFTQLDKDGNVTAYDGLNFPEFDLVLTAVNGTCSNNRITVKNGMALTYFTLTQMSSASLTGSFNGIESTINFTFKKSTPELTIDVNDINVGSAANIVVNVPSDATGTVILKVGNITKNAPISNSKATFSIPDLPAGSYVIEANYTGNSKYKSVVEKSNLTVNKNNSTTVISAGAIELNKDAIFTFTLSDGATGTVDVYVNGDKETINVGQTYTIHNISRGNYVVRAVYNGDSYYLPSEDEYSFEVGKLIPAITVTAPDITYGADTIVSVNLNNDATGSVVVTVDGKSITSQLNGGKASVSISGINAGTNKVIDVYYGGDNNYKNATITKTYNVGKASLNFTINSNNIKLGQNAVVTIQLPQRSGGTLTITGIKSETRNIPLTGLVTLTYSDLTLGTYTVSAKYNGDNYQTVSKSTTFTVSDWNASQWPNEGYDLKNNEKSPYSSETNGNIMWIKNIDGSIVGNMAIDSAGNVYVTTTNGIYSFDNKGKLIWNFNSDSAGENFSGISISRGEVISPKIGDKLYFINQTTGEQFNGNMYYGSSLFAPVVDENGTVYISGEDAGGSNLVIIPYKLWHTGTQPINISLGSVPSMAPVLINDNIVAVGTNNNIVLVEISSKSVIANLPVIPEVRPVVGPGNAIYTISQNSIIGITPEGNRVVDVKIQGTPGNYISIGENGEVYSITKEGALYDYSANDDNLIYDFKETISSRLLVGLDGKLYVGSESGMFYSIDTDGNLLWKVNLNQSVSGIPVMDKNGVIYVNSGNRIIALNNAPLKDSKLSADIKNVSYGSDVTVDISLDAQATGKLSIKIEDKYTNESTVENGKVSFKVQKLYAGVYTARITYSGDEQFKTKTIDVKFRVDKLNITLDTSHSNIKIGEDLKVTVIGLPSDAKGNIKLSVSDKSKTNDIVKDGLTLTISGLEYGDYRYTVSYMGDDNYNPVSVSKPFSVGYVQTSFTASVKDINVGENLEININGLSSDVKGLMVVNLNNQNYTAAVQNGIAKIVVPNLPYGNYNNISVNLINDPNYAADTQKISFNVNKINPTFNVDVKDISVGESLVIDVSNLPNDATGTVTVVIGNISKSSGVGNGKAKVTVSDYLANGTYSVNVIYSGDAKYTSINTFKTVKVNKITPSFVVGVDNIFVGDELKITVSGLPNDASGNISVSVAGKTNMSAVKDGIAHISILDLSAGTYNVDITYSGDNKFNSKNDSKQVKVSKRDVNMVVTANETINVGDDLYITVSGLPQDVYGYLFISGLDADCVIKNGVSNIKISNLTSGTYSYSISYAQNDKYNNKTISKTVTVSKIHPEIRVEAPNVNIGDNLTIKVILPKDITNENIFIKFNNSEEEPVDIIDGIATFTASNLTRGSYSYSIYYGFNDKYEFNKYINGTVDVGKENITFNVETKDISYGETAVVEISDFPDDASGKITVRVIQTNEIIFANVSKGKAIINISSLSAGKYNLEISYTDDNKYMADKQNDTIIKVNKIDPKINISSNDINYGDILNIIVNLPKEINQEILISCGEFNQVLNVVNGTVSADISNLSAGNKLIKVDYSGNNNYNAISLNKTVNVNKITPKVDILASDITFGQTLTVQVNLTKGTTGTVVISVDGVSKTVDLINSLASASIPNLSAGSKNINVVYSGDKNYTGTSKSQSVKIDKIVPSLEISSNNTNYGESLNIAIELSDNITDNVIVSVDGKNSTLKVKNGVAFTSISGLNAGNKTIYATYVGNDKYYSVSNNYAVVINRITPTIAISAHDINYGDNLEVQVTLPKDATGYVNLTIENTIETLKIANGVAKTTIHNLASGLKNIHAVYLGDMNYVQTSISKQINVNGTDPVINIAAGSINYGEKLNVVVNLPKDAVGNVNLLIDNQSLVGKVNNGAVSFEIDNLNAGINKVINVIYSSDNDNYNDARGVKLVNVTKITPNIVIDAKDINYLDDLSVRVTLPADVSGSINLTVGNVRKTLNIDKGVVVTSIPNLSAGTKLIIVEYGGDNNYNPAYVNKSITVNKLNSAISIQANDIKCGENLIVKINLTDGATGSLTVSLDNISQTIKISDSYAIFNISKLTSGNKTIKVSYGGDNNYKASSASKIVSVDKNTPEITISADSISYGDDLTVNIRMDADVDGNIVVYVGDKSQNATLSNGNAVIRISGLNAGNYTLRAVYAGNDFFNSVSSNADITVSSSEPFINVIAPGEVKNDNAVIVLELPEDATGNAIISLDGKVVGTVPIKNGTANVTLNNLNIGQNIVNVEYSGDNNYLSISKNISITKSTNIGKKTVIVVLPEFSHYANDYFAGERGEFFYATLKDTDGNLLVNKTVSIVLNGPVYNVTTDQYGRAGLQINLVNANLYTYALFFQGDEEYCASYLASCKLTLIKKPISIVASSVTFKSAQKTKSVSVSLKTIKNHDGKYYLKSGKKVTLKVNGKTYSAKINKLGLAKFNIKLTKKGKYTAKINFAGDNTYNPSSKSINIKIK